MKSRAYDTESMWDQLARLQFHAQDDFMGKALGRPCRGLPRRWHPETRLWCPICAKRLPLDEGFTCEHGPPESAPTSFNTFQEAGTYALTCWNCNRKASEKYESKAARDRDSSKIEAVQDVSIPSRVRVPRMRKSRTGMWVPVSTRAQELTDIKAAFVVFFTALGYSAALARELKPVREVIMSGRLNRDVARPLLLPDGALRDITGWQVIEVKAPYACVIIRGANGFSMMLPMPGYPRLPDDLPPHCSTTRMRPWPDLHTDVAAAVAEVHRAGSMFHWDLCRTCTWDVEWEIADDVSTADDQHR